MKSSKKKTENNLKPKAKIKPQKSRILQMAGKYSHLAKNVKIDIDNIRDYIDYGNL